MILLVVGWQVFAVTDGQWTALAAVVVALIAAIASVVAALIGLSTKRSADEAKISTEQRIGTPNGHGNLVQMMERLLHGQTGQDERIAVIEGRQMDQAQRLTAIEETQANYCAKVPRVEA